MWFSKLRLMSVVLLLAVVGGLVSASIAIPPADAFSQAEKIYRLGMFSDIRTTNSMTRIRVSTVYDSYTQGMRHCSLYTLSPTQFYYVPSLAAESPFKPGTNELNLVREPDGTLSITIKLKKGVLWSDRTEVTADDVIFSYMEPLKFGLAKLGWTFPDANFVKAEKIDSHTVKLFFKAFTHRIQWTALFHNIFQKKYWEPIWKEAMGANPPTTSDRVKLEAVAGLDEPACGWGATPEALKVPGKGWERGAFFTNIANPNFFFKGVKVTEFSGGKYTEEKPGVYKYEQAVPVPLAVEKGGVPPATYTVGPFIDQALYRVFGTTAAVVSALTKADPDIDFFLNPLGLDPGFRVEYARQPQVQIEENRSHGMFYASFNFRRMPFGTGPLQENPRFRDEDIIGSRFRLAANCLVDRQFLTDVLFQKVAFPMFTTVPESNPSWYNPAVKPICSEFTELTDPRTARAKKVDVTVKLLKSVGFTWEVEPKADTATGAVSAGRGIIMPTILNFGTPEATGIALKAGETKTVTAPAGTLAAGLKVPIEKIADVTTSLGAIDKAGKASAPVAAGATVTIAAKSDVTVKLFFYGRGAKMPEFELIHPNAAYDNRRYLFGIKQEGWMNQVGIPVRSVPSGFNLIVDTIDAPAKDFDMYSLGWALGLIGGPPLHLESFFHTRWTVQGAPNRQGYSNPEVDALIDKFLSEPDFDKARALAFQLQDILDVDSPYIVIFDALIVDAWRKDKVKFPYTRRTAGIVGAGGLGSVAELLR